MRPTHPWLIVLMLPSLAVMAVFLVGLVLLARYSLIDETGFTLRNYEAFFARADYRASLLRTLEIAFLTTVVAALIGYPLAFALARAKRYREILMLLVILPWLVSLVVRTYGWIVILGSRGTLNSLLISFDLLDRPLRLLFTQTGVVIGLVHVLLPFMVISIASVLMQVDRSVEEASKMLGAGPMRTFWRVTFPLSLPGLVSGSTIVFLLGTGAIITPYLLGGPRNSMLATQIYQDVFQVFDFPKAATMAFVLMACAAIIVLPLQYLERRILRNYKGGA